MRTFCFLLAFSVGVAVRGATVALVWNARAEALVTVGDQAPWLARHAADELVRYVKAMGGVELGDRPTGTMPAPLEILVGTYRDHPGIKRLCDRRELNAPVEDAKRREFFVAEPVGRRLVLSGKQDLCLVLCHSHRPGGAELGELVTEAPWRTMARAVSTRRSAARTRPVHGG